MFGKKHEAHVIVLNDLDDGREAVRRALESASAEEVPGLQRALRILDESASAEDPKIRWTREVLAKAGIDPLEREVHAVREVRKELPGLSLVAAVDMVRALNADAKQRR
ncbi:hypothetical protein SAMN05421805_10889 [Saccharopolyspora antimicrobica]|uniref:Uncharacterized protein n=1 Tax=Saccharopolyspora antimicrobica TaxID=455193 RepID=A0A1I5DCH6_9PSEU|nr:hypothetical protein [Saccharopolyspora antimicrobica]RKT85164.1 hypothetical protein ATL45_3501 [Saccharopolyspora antimicrobica]SFN96955.1 hypothetical protein SAMN05421805_10889 [Saccharopolyspora antimicrobica]